MRAGWLLVMAACAQPAAPVPTVPAAPVLEEVSLVQRRRVFTVHGTAADELIVRIFTDSACAGPVYRQTTGAGLAAGVRVELIPGEDNFFSARAVSPEGLASDCSTPLRLKYVAAQRPGRPSVDVQPQSPSREFEFHVRGASDPGTVRLHENTCVTPVLAELSAVEFFEPGFAVQLMENQTRTVAVEVINEDMSSDCVAVTLINDRIPPSLTLRLASPTPSAEYYAWVVIGGDATFVDFSRAPDCSGLGFQSCNGCRVLPVCFSPGVTTFSALGRDRAGNEVCVVAPQPWVQDSSLPEGEAMVLSPPVSYEGFSLMPFLVPANRPTVSLFQSADCSGPSRDWPTSAVVPSLYLEGTPTGGPLSMRGLRRDGGADPCSNSVPWR